MLRKVIQNCGKPLVVYCTINVTQIDDNITENGGQFRKLRELHTYN